MAETPAFLTPAQISAIREIQTEQDQQSQQQNIQDFLQVVSRQQARRGQPAQQPEVPVEQAPPKKYIPTRDSLEFPSYFLHADIQRRINPDHYKEGVPCAATTLFGYRKSDGSRNKTSTEILWGDQLR